MESINYHLAEQSIMKNLYISIWIASFFFIGIPDAAYGQQSIKVGISTSRALVENTNDFGTEVGLLYQHQLLHIKSDLYLFGSAGLFWQPTSWEGNGIYATDVPQYDRTRYGGSIGTGLFLNGTLLNARLGIQFSQHVAQLDKAASGMPPATGDYSPAPEHFTRSYSLLGGSFQLEYNFSESLFINTVIAVETNLDSQHHFVFFRPSFGLGYRF